MRHLLSGWFRQWPHLDLGAAACLGLLGLLDHDVVYIEGVSNELGCRFFVDLGAHDVLVGLRESRNV